MPIVYLSLGSNLGDRDRNLQCALETLEGPPLHITRISSLYRTVPVGETEQPVPDYLNCVVEAETSLPPDALLDYTQAAERRCGRTPTFRWGPRAIDIDIVWYDGIAVETDRLTIPHRHAKERAFVLVPIAELAPHLDFGGGVTVSDLLRTDDIANQQVLQLTN